MKPLSALFALLVLASCGVQGKPVPPNQVPAQSQDGVTIHGQARVGVVAKG